MLLTEVTVAFILKFNFIISLPSFQFDMINGLLLIVNGNYIKVSKSLLNGVHFTMLLFLAFL